MPRPLRLLIVEDSQEDCELLLGHLRRHGYDVVSGTIGEETAVTALKAGAQFLQKPFSPEALARKIRESLSSTTEAH